MEPLTIINYYENKCFTSVTLDLFLCLCLMFIKAQSMWLYISLRHMLPTVKQSIYLPNKTE